MKIKKKNEIFAKTVIHVQQQNSIKISIKHEKR